jgi:Leucine-rich repeat (LRR) protein
MLITLQQLQSGIITPESLGPEKRLQLAEGLTEFPRELFALADHLQVLDMSDNKLSELPSDFGRFKRLKLLFLSNNEFDHLPNVISDCSELEMIGFKSNQINVISETALPAKTRWLILTDNQISKLPESIGNLTRLRKLALAGNQLTALPVSMSQCESLELIRLSANQFKVMPDWLFQLPKLAWLAFSGNPCTVSNQVQVADLPQAELKDIKLLQQIGMGASGVIHKAQWLNKNNESTGNPTDDIAVKLFKGRVTSDGYPQDELDCCLTAGEHKNLIKTIGFIPNPKQLGLLMALIPSTYRNLGLPPSLITCTRDTFEQGTQFDIDVIITVIKQMVSTVQHLHNQGVSHGDIYAHNIMVDEQSNALFGDFGAATQLTQLPMNQQLAMEKIEVRALGNLLEDLLLNCNTGRQADTKLKINQLTGLVKLCHLGDIDTRIGLSRLNIHLQVC